jgi:hypothetical protein
LSLRLAGQRSVQVEAVELSPQPSVSLHPRRTRVRPDALDFGAAAAPECLPPADRRGVAARKHRGLLADRIAVALVAVEQAVAIEMTQDACSAAREQVGELGFGWGRGRMERELAIGSFGEYTVDAACSIVGANGDTLMNTKAAWSFFSARARNQRLGASTRSCTRDFAADAAFVPT